MTRRRRYAFLFAALLMAAATGFAQSNDMIDSILQEEVATVGSAAYVALSAADLVPDEATRDRAVTVAREAGWLPAEAAADDPATFGTFAYLLMAAVEVDGGLMYRLIPGPRYAAREFVYQGWSPERRAPGDVISGQFMIRVTGNFLDSVEASR